MENWTKIELEEEAKLIWRSDEHWLDCIVGLDRTIANFFEKLMLDQQ